MPALAVLVLLMTQSDSAALLSHARRAQVDFERIRMFLLPAGFVPQPSPFGVTFSGPAFSEPKLIGYAYAFEQATKHRVAPASVPPLASDTVGAR